MVCRIDLRVAEEPLRHQLAEMGRIGLICFFRERETAQRCLT